MTVCRSGSIRGTPNRKDGINKSNIYVYIVFSLNMNMILLYNGLRTLTIGVLQFCFDQKNLLQTDRQSQVWKHCQKNKFHSSNGFGSHFHSFCVLRLKFYMQ
jgi:hypothetical protein